MDHVFLTKLEQEGCYPIESNRFKGVVYFFDPKTRCINITTKNDGNLAVDIINAREFIEEFSEITKTYKEDIACV